MRTIWKYDIPPDDNFKIDMPRIIEFLCIRMQRGIPVFWVLVDPDSPMKTREFMVVGTGRDADKCEVGKYMGTFEDSMNLVWHLWVR